MPMLDYLREDAWQRQVIELAQLAGWRIYHTWSSLHSPSGFPDLVCVRPPRIVMIELKSERGRISRPQQEWLTALERCPGVEAYVWRPRDWEAVVEILQRVPA